MLRVHVLQSSIVFPFLIIILELCLKEIVDDYESVQIPNGFDQKSNNYEHDCGLEKLGDLVSVLLNLNSWVALLNLDLANDNFGCSDHDISLRKDGSCMQKLDKVNAESLAYREDLLISECLLVLDSVSLAINHLQPLPSSLDHSMMLPKAEHIEQNNKEPKCIQYHKQVAHVHHNSCALLGLFPILRKAQQGYAIR